MGEILSQCTHTSNCISNHHKVHFEYLTILFVNYITIKLKKKKNLNLGPINDFKIWGGGEFTAKAAAELRKEEKYDSV